MTTYSCRKYQLIFGTQYRRPLLAKAMRQELYACIGGIIRDEGGNLDSIGSIEDQAFRCMAPKQQKLSGGRFDIFQHGDRYFAVSHELNRNSDALIY